VVNNAAGVNVNHGGAAPVPLAPVPVDGNGAPGTVVGTNGHGTGSGHTGSVPEVLATSLSERIADFGAFIRRTDAGMQEVTRLVSVLMRGARPVQGFAAGPPHGFAPMLQGFPHGPMSGYAGPPYDPAMHGYAWTQQMPRPVYFGQQGGDQQAQ
jgi:hypothetical protein